MRRVTDPRFVVASNVDEDHLSLEVYDGSDGEGIAVLKVVDGRAVLETFGEIQIEWGVLANVVESFLAEGTKG